MKQCDDKTLIALIRNSDYAAFDELHYRFWKPLYIHAVKKTGNKEDAFDLVQDLFTDLWDKRRSLPEIDAPLKYYLRSSIIFKIAAHFRARGFHEKHLNNFEAFLKHETAPLDHADLSELRNDSLEFDSLLEVINNTIKGMPEKMQRIFLMSRSGKYSISQIAEFYMISPQTVKNQISNALKRLRKASIMLLF